MPSLRLRPVLVNRYETLTDQLLAAAAVEHGDRLLAKVRLADVVDADELGGAEKSFALSAHLDFLMVDAASSMPKFAVELDGAQHWTDPTVRRRDRLKDTLCERAELPLLRITSDLVTRRLRWPVLTYVIDAFYLSEAFYEAQLAGQIPWDEPFMITSFLMPRQADGLGFYSLDHDARLWLLDAYESGRIPHYATDEIVTIDPASGAIQAHAFVAVVHDRYLAARVRVRDFLFRGIAPSELASQLVTVEIRDLADQWLAGQPVACNGRRLDRYIDEVQRAVDAGGFLSSGTGGALKAGDTCQRHVKVQFRACDGRPN